MRKVWIAASLAVLFCVVGFWFDTDTEATILEKYTTQTMLKLGLITMAGYFSILLLRFLLFPEESSRLRVIPLRTKFYVAITVFLLGFVATEGVLLWRTHKYQKKLIETRKENVEHFDPFLQIVPKPNDKKLHINRWGFRGENIEKIKPPNTIRIFVLGGSTVYCGNVEFELSHPRVLEKLLVQRYLAMKIEVLNAGMPWYTSKHSLMNFLFKVQDFNPDIIIIYHGINDLYRSFSPKEFASGPYRNDYSHFYGPVAPIVREYIKEQSSPGILTLERSRNFFLRHWFADFRDVSKPESTSDLSEVSVNTWPSLIAFERNMDNLASLAKTLGIDLVIASQPYLYRNDLNDKELKAIWFPKRFCRIGRSMADISSMIKGMEAFNEVARQIANSHGVLFIDLEKVVPKSLDYFTDDVHYTEEGNRIIGRYFAEQIIASGIITKNFSEKQQF